MGDWGDIRGVLCLFLILGWILIGEIGLSVLFVWFVGILEVVDMIEFGFFFIGLNLGVGCNFGVLFV